MFLKIALMIPIFLTTSLTDAQSFEMFGIDILSANRHQITESILQLGAKKLPSNNPFADRYDANALFPGARMKVVFTVDEKLEKIVCQFDSGCMFAEVLKFDELEQILGQRYGKPIVTAASNRKSDFEKELKWTINGVEIQLVSYEWHAAWRIHVTHRLCFTVL